MNTPEELLEIAEVRLRTVSAATAEAVRDLSSRLEACRSHSASDQIGRSQIVVELTSALVERARALDQEAGALADILDRAKARMGTPTPSPPRASAPEATGSPPRQRAEVSGFKRSGFIARARAGRAKPSVNARPEGLRLLATQMAVAGSTRAEIEQRLATDFGVERADEVLDEVFSDPRIRQ